MNLSFASAFRIVGLILAVIGGSMLPSFVVSLIYDNSSVYIPFLITMLSSVAAGVFLLKIFQHDFRTLRVKDGFLVVTLCWFFSAAVGAVPFVVTGSIPNPIDAFFESCSGFSTTGASILTDVEVLPKGILFWRSFTHWIGGMGILVFAIALMPSLGISGQNIAVTEAPGPIMDKTSAQMSKTAKTLYIMYLIFTVLEVILLLFGGMSLFDALVHTFGSVGTGGFSSYNDSIAHFNSTYIEVVIMVFMVLCGVNFNLYYLAFKDGISQMFKDSEFRFYLLIFGVSALMIATVLFVTGKNDSIGGAAVDAAFQTASILTTTGYMSSDYEVWPFICQMILFFLMIVGGCSSSTSGGLKAIRILIISKLIRRGISLRLHPNVIETVKLDGKTLQGDTVSSIANHFFLYILMVFAGTFLISFENESLITSLSSVVTCLGNVGPGFGSIGPTENFAHLTLFSKGILSVYMLAGRLELYPLFILLTPRFWNQDY